uniref:Uncharacterized protein n=1 Tax=Timema tahoe TaxID=61484 RepID=A0A7R9ISE3_9NEOP|nr:unnamed protein product [Timema tahoe]
MQVVDTSRTMSSTDIFKAGWVKSSTLLGPTCRQSQVELRVSAPAFAWNESVKPFRKKHPRFTRPVSNHDHPVFEAILTREGPDALDPPRVCVPAAHIAHLSQKQTSWFLVSDRSEVWRVRCSACTLPFLYMGLLLQLV